MYHTACKVEFQPFKRSYSQLTFFNILRSIIKFLASSANCSCTTVPTVQRFTAVGTLWYFFLCYYFHVVYPTLLLKLYYSVTRSVLLVTCRLQYCSSYSVLYGPFCKKDTVCTVGFNCSAFATLLQRYVTQCLRIIMCCLHAVCCTVIFLYCSVDALLYTAFHVDSAPCSTACSSNVCTSIIGTLLCPTHYGLSR